MRSRATVVLLTIDFELLLSNSAELTAALLVFVFLAFAVSRIR